MNGESSELNHWRGYFECTRAITPEALVALAKDDRGRAAELVQVTHDAAVSIWNASLHKHFELN
jgi:hypothetical protein